MEQSAKRKKVKDSKELVIIATNTVIDSASVRRKMQMWPRLRVKEAKAVSKAKLKVLKAAIKVDSKEAKATRGSHVPCVKMTTTLQTLAVLSVEVEQLCYLCLECC